MNRSRTIATAGIMLGLAGVCEAQEPPEIKLEDLRVPASPAFVLMGIEPRTVERPRTPRAFGLSVVQATNELSGLPKNYAMEFAPFWLVPHPNLEFRPDLRQGIGATIIQTLSLSLATATDSTAGRTSVGLGFRALLARGSTPDSVRILIDSIGKIQTAILETDDEAEVKRLPGLISPLAKQVQRTLYTTGFRLEVAGAAMGSFDGGRFGSGRLSRLGFWITPSYQLARPRLDVSAVFRAIFNRGDRSGANLDYGGRLSYDLAPLTISYELVGRASIDATVTTTDPNGQPTGTFTLDNTYRSAGSVEYKLGPGSSVLLSFGRNFTEGNARNLIASVTLNLGLGAVPIVSLKP